MSQSAAIQTWANNQAEEDGMNEGHSHIWLRMIEQCGLSSLQGKTVLDFGCNQGGFLRMLHKQLPFGEAVGVDLAQASLDIARQRKPWHVPVSYEHAGCLDTMVGKFDVAFSHEVIYLLPDLDAHAETIKRVLKPGGIYLASTGCYVENPLWPKWREYIASYSNVPVPDYSINAYSDAFIAAGFKAEVRQLQPSDFMDVDPNANNTYFQTTLDHLAYHNNHKILFRFSIP